MNALTSLVCVGNLTIDEAVTPAGERTESVGGDALFAALAAKLAGAVPAVVAPLGDDAPAELLDALRIAGTEPAHLPRRDRPVVRNVVRYADNGDRVWELVLGDDHFEEMSVRPGDMPAALLNAPGVLLSGMALQAQLELAAWLRPRTRATVYFDPQEDYIAGNEAALHDAIRGCDVFLPSEIEATALAGTTDLTAAAAGFLELGPGVVVIKRAEAGCLVATRADPDPRPIPADPVVDPVDSTGAGDAFCGAFAAHHLRGADPYTAAHAGAIAARVAVSAPGLAGLLAAVADSVEPR